MKERYWFTADHLRDIWDRDKLGIVAVVMAAAILLWAVLADGQ